MDTQSLVEELQKRSQLLGAQEIGAEFLAKLDASGLMVTDAFWSYVDADEQWILYLGMPSVDDNGLYETARQLHIVYNQMSDRERRGLTMSDVEPVSPNSDKVLAMRRRYGSQEYGRGLRIARKDAFGEPFIYRLNQ